MANAVRRANIRPRRRRHDDGEEEGSAAGDLDDSSMSEGSAISNLDEDADAEGSDVSAEDDVSLAVADTKPPAPMSTGVRLGAANGRPTFGFFTPAADTEAMVNGLKAQTDEPETLQFEELEQSDVAKSKDKQSNEASQTPNETLAQRNRREHLAYIKQRDSNPAFVPNRGGFFLHDDRSSGNGGPFVKSYQRGRGRGYGPPHGIGRGYGPVNEATDKPWAHDLHDTVNKTAPEYQQQHQPFPLPRVAPSLSHIPTAKAAAQAPNRAFSVTTVLGNVTIHMSLPDIEEKKTYTNVVKKQYTLLPQHRPPLRRDKPVRISIPDELPRFIFPSTERSFIFIPRALRPNQQSFARGRGRGSFPASRRTSMLGGSVYTPSVGMSRKSSMSGVPTNGLHTPTDSIMRGGMYSANVPRPVVRMPTAPVPIMVAHNAYMPTSAGPQTPTMPDHGGPGPAILQSPLAMIPMHQPRPQKTVSVAEIESPDVKAPFQQQEQPFHQQVPNNLGLHDNQLQPGMTGGTSLSHIPEGAVYAQPFQPYPVYSTSAYYGMPYPPAPMHYQPMPEGYTYMPAGGPVMTGQFVQGHSPAAFAPASHGHEAAQGHVAAHESNGTVYYYNQSQYPVDGSMSQYAGNGMMQPAPYYYSTMPPQNMYYPPPPGQ